MSKLLGDFSFTKQSFPDKKQIFAEFQKESFAEKNDFQKSCFISKSLLDLISKEKDPCFLLPSVLDFISDVDSKKMMSHYNFSTFELWLNQYSGLAFEENRYIRAKVVGKWIPREEYQENFPIGMKKIYEGSHFVTAHKSPDLDSMISSFWGWMDAFAAKVSKGMHFWNLPGGPPGSKVEVPLLFTNIFGEALFTHLVKKRQRLTLNSADLISQEGVVAKTLFEKISILEESKNKLVFVIVDDRGFYLGDWKSYDAERVREVSMLLNHCLRWFENNLQLLLISLFAKKDLSKEDIIQSTKSFFGMKIESSDPVLEFTDKQKQYLDSFLKKIFSCLDGLESTFLVFAKALSVFSLLEFSDVYEKLCNVNETDLFDDKGNIKENRPILFSCLESWIKDIQASLQSIRKFVEKTDVSLQIKKLVLQEAPTFVTLTTEAEGIRSKMGPHRYLTVVSPDDGKFIPVGMVLAEDIREPVLGTVSLRDFSNFDEITIAPYLDVISIVDHHKSSISTRLPSCTIISDAQASNTIMAQKAFAINAKYSLGAMNYKGIQEQLKQEESTSVLSKLLLKKSILEKKESFFIHPDREFLEYLQFLYGILDDTDLLMKVSNIDIETIVGLLNRLKTIMLKKEVEIIDLQDIEKNQDFVRKAASRILQNEDMYSLYKKVYLQREEEVEKMITISMEDKPSNIFADTKVQNGCARIGQMKVFLRNIPSFEKAKFTLQNMWTKASNHFYKEQNEIDLHLFMISTIRGSEEVFSNKFTEYTHKDELWIWIPSNDSGLQHLQSFLSSFSRCPNLKDNPLEVQYYGKNSKELDEIITDSFIPIKEKKFTDEDMPIAVIRYKAGSINSRKALISPYLPKL